MERLTAFEFITASDSLQLVRLKRRDEVLVQLGLFTVFMVDLRAIGSVFEFETRDDLTFEGVGLGHPYWNDEMPPWALVFDPRAEAQRIAAIRAAAQREVNRALISMS
jgi:hypothetical protein